MIRLTNVSKSYAKSAVKAVDDISLDINDGEIFGFLGPNGAGKSTTIKMLTGILRPDSGTIEVGGIDIARDSIAAKNIIGFVPDNHELYDTLKGTEYLSFVGEMYGVSNKLLVERTEKYADMFKMTNELGNYIGSYSHGMKQKLMIIAALVHEPKVWILDEPLTGLDPQSAYQLKTAMRAHADEGNTVFFSSHVIDVVEKVCDRIAIIDKGRIVAVDTLDNIRRNPDTSLEEIFLSATAADNGND
ncbi:MAG TPA: 3-dehydroquinate dehydratase [Clostridiales bacterium]|nr:3-dehydroquinate dehydratase [Clostridiales bacterium]